MPNTALLAPVFALAAWTACILLLLGWRRVSTGLRGQVPVQAYTRGEAPGLPDAVALPNRNYMNLLELPLLFYVVCLLAHVTGSASPAAVALAWAYVVLRVVHSLIHLSYNHVLHRFAAFALSNLVLLGLWGVVGQALFGA